MEAAIHADSQTESGQTGSVSRNRNIDIVRSIAPLWVMIYHIWTLTGGARITNPVLDDFIRLAEKSASPSSLSSAGTDLSFARSQKPDRAGSFSPL